jgi:iron complex outermembrane receptor protein
MVVTGSILSDEMAPIAGANIEVLGENRYTTTDADGKFSITANSANSQIKISHAGYDYDTVAAGDFKSYYQLFPAQLDGNIVVNSNSSSNALLYVLGFTAVAVLIYNISKPKARTVKV